MKTFKRYLPWILGGLTLGFLFDVVDILVLTFLR